MSEPRSALVTGAARRIGRAIASDLAAHGYAVAIHAHRSVDAAHELATDLAAAHGVATGVVTGDLADPDDVARLVPAATEAVGPLGVLVNNASIFEADEAPHLDSALWRRQMAINAEAPAMLASAFARIAGRGLVVNLIDQRVWKPTPRYASYSASKATLWWLTRTLAQALAPAVRVVAVAPGPVLPAASQSQDEFDRLTSTILLQRAPALAEFGKTIRFLHDTPSLTGQMIALDGGQHLGWETPDALVNE
ncbi:SDR family oxidoreductase [Acuticoccus mangrovi]|uniref:SDR family oxidoreductase n=1 Tax=Acuticoccus mangrovi TaxID=2796142 RepID=A0A934MI59_9HYPH|nr:SDR family oxidoreductase [Acuticoccus mangrovi]MBJ3776831.1 SDR family oxidoreductase [Acuticoccus mangrovi]